MLVVTVCGVDESDPNYADALAHNLPGVTVKQLFWYGIPLTAEAQVEEAEAKAKMWKQFAEHSLRELIDSFLGDALVWFNPTIKEQIKETLKAQLTGLKPDVLVLHSWACCMIPDLFSDFNFVEIFSNVKHVITCGSPLLAYDRLVKDKLTDSFPFKWTNFFNKFDLIAFPLAGYLSSDITDIKVTDSGPQEPSFLLGDAAILLAGDAHTSYWRSKQMARAILDG